MKSVFKRLTKQRGITIPKDICFEAGLHAGQAVDMSVDSGKVVISAAIPVCKFCGSPQNVKKAMGIHICRVCAEKLHRKVNDNE